MYVSYSTRRYAARLQVIVEIAGNLRGNEHCQPISYNTECPSV
jgi:hypothetical protein